MNRRDYPAPLQPLDWRGVPPIDTDRQAYQRGFRRGWWAAAAFYVVGSVVLIMAFHWLGVRP